MKVTARNLDFARELADKGRAHIGPRVFKVPAIGLQLDYSEKEREFLQFRHE